MNDSKISVRYAKALYQSALEADSLKEVMKDILLIETAWKTAGFTDMLYSPVVTTSSKKKVISAVFKGNISQLSFDFLMLLLGNKRENYIEAIFRNFKALFKDHEGIKSAEIILSSKIDDNIKKKFLTLLEKTFSSKIELIEQLKPEIIGGFILKVEDQQYDASVSSGLKKIKKRLLETSIEK
jgi:F-type H+-transporting ATPase subunit delta